MTLLAYFKLFIFVVIILLILELMFKVECPDEDRYASLLKYSLEK
jgi:hypothetical protein